MCLCVHIYIYTYGNVFVNLKNEITKFTCIQIKHDIKFIYTNYVYVIISVFVYYRLYNTVYIVDNLIIQILN